MYIENLKYKYDIIIITSYCVELILSSPSPFTFVPYKL